MGDQASHVKMLLNTGKVVLSLQDRDGRAALNYAILNFSPSCIRVSVAAIEMNGKLNH